MTPEVIDKCSYRQDGYDQQPLSRRTLKAEDSIPGLKNRKGRFLQQQDNKEYQPEDNIAGISQQELSLGNRSHPAAANKVGPFLHGGKGANPEAPEILGKDKSQADQANNYDVKEEVTLPRWGKSQWPDGEIDQA